MIRHRSLPRFARLLPALLILAAVGPLAAVQQLAAQETGAAPEIEESAPAEASGTSIYPLAVMVDNFPASRPQTGLAAADIVYEALAEGGITRFLAIYSGPGPELVGPVRSARHYYVYWAAEYNAPVVHVMASDEGYAAFVNTGLPDLDEHRGDPGFQRSPDRPMPYNTYTSPAFDRQILSDYGALWPGSLGGLERQQKSGPIRGSRASSLEITYPISNYTVSWTYDRAERLYLRSQAGGPHIDAATGQQISAANVIVQFMPAWEFAFRGGESYLDMQLTGAGRAVYFQAGVAIEGAWHRQSLGNQTEYFGPSGQLVGFRPGPVWVQVVPSGPLEGTLVVNGALSP
jgi:hypothetical protein